MFRSISSSILFHWEVYLSLHQYDILLIIVAFWFLKNSKCKSSNFFSFLQEFFLETHLESFIISIQIAESYCEPLRK